MRLMVSVVSAHEAREAAKSGAVLLDIKNPAEGSLGAQFPKVIREIRKVTSSHIALSAAVGDMPNLPGTAALATLGAAVCGADYVKVGLFGINTEADAISLMRAVREAVAGYPISVIAAGYADHERIGSVNPNCLPGIAAAAAVQGCLVDTAIKDGHSLFDYVSIRELSAICRQSHRAGLHFAAAGALTPEQLPSLRVAGVDIAGVRTAVCRNGNRNGPLDPDRLANLLRSMKSSPTDRVISI